MRPPVTASPRPTATDGSLDAPLAPVAMPVIAWPAQLSSRPSSDEMLTPWRPVAHELNGRYAQPSGPTRRCPERPGLMKTHWTGTDGANVLPPSLLTAHESMLVCWQT